MLSMRHALMPTNRILFDMTVPLAVWKIRNCPPAIDEAA
jgi:hypothetical protein